MELCKNTKATVRSLDSDTDFVIIAKISQGNALALIYL